MKTLYFLLTISIMCFISCSEEEVNPVDLSGTYEGIFLANDLALSLKKSGPVTLILHEKGYECIGNPNLVPAGGQGTFVKKDGKLIFNEQGVWKQVKQEMVLQGKYSYFFDGENLELWRDSDKQSLKYVLKKQ